jgi:hypothetical protein
MKSRDVLIGAFLGGLLVILIVDHDNGKSAQHQAAASASAGHHRASASPSAHRSRHHLQQTAHPQKTGRPGAHGAPTGPSPAPHVSPHVTAAGSSGSSGAGWLIGIGSVIAIVFSAAAVTITVRAGRAGTTTSHIG